MSREEQKHDELVERHCVPCEGGMRALDAPTVTQLLARVPGWAKRDRPDSIERAFPFREYSRVLAFANAVGWIAIRENHHPVLELHFGQCVVRYYTHALGGLSENDFICAAKVNSLYDG